MVCKQCGRELPDRAIYCRYCGARVADEELADSEKIVLNNKRPRRFLPILIALLVLGALVAGFFLLLHGRKPPEQGLIVDPATDEEPTVAPVVPVDYTLRIEGDDNIEAGKSVILKSVVLPETELINVEWSSSDKEIAAIQDGVVTGVSEGSSIIRCHITTADGQELTAMMPFKVVPKPVSYKAELSPKTLELHAGSAEDLTITVVSDPPGEDILPETVWESADSKIAAVTGGRVQAVGEGATRITAKVTLPDGSTVSLQSTVRVSPAESNPVPEPSQIPTPQPAPEPAPAPAPEPEPAPAPDPTPAAPDPAGAELQRTEEYIVANVDKDIISLDSLRTLSDVDLILARNEIFARHGRRFATGWIQDYFDKQSWYQGTITPEDFDADVLNDIERANVRRMQYVEEHE